MWWLVFGDPMKRRVAQFMGIEWIAMVLAIPFIFVFLQVCIIRTIINARRDHGPAHFDKENHQLIVGPSFLQETHPLEMIVAVQFLRTTLQDCVAPARSISATRAKVEPDGFSVKAIRWGMGRVKVGQLNLVFKDGSRLNVANGTNKALPVTIAQRIADFLGVPLLWVEGGASDTQPD